MTGPQAEQRRLGALVVALAGVVVLAALLRFPGLDVKPLHSDEGVNGWFSLRLYWWNVYRYQPADYHGPFLYYVNLIAFWLMGPSEWSLRGGTALFGAMTPLLLLPARRWLGSAGVLVAAVLIAVAPCMVYFSRTVIHETYLIFFTTLWAVALLRYAAEPSLRWGLAATAGAFGAFANKETAIITTGSLGVGALLAWSLGKAQPAGGRDPDLFGGRTRAEALGGWLPDNWAVWLVGLGAFSFMLVALFSSFFTYWPGVPGFFEAFFPWLEHGTTGRNQKKDWLYFWEVMQDTEGWAVWPAVAAMVWATVKRHRLGLAITGWALASFTVYSLIPYKTPWCVLNIDLPVFLLCAWLAGQGWRSLTDSALHPAGRAAAALVLLSPVAAVPQLALTSLEDSRERYDDDAVEYVYVQTQRGFLEMMSDHLGVGGAGPEADPLGPYIVNVSAKNPARWYLITRGWDHNRSTYTGEVPDEEDVLPASIVVASGKHTGATRTLIHEDASWHEETYALRPGWHVTAWYRQELWDAYQAAGGRDAFAWPIPASDSVHEPPKPRRYLSKREKRRADAQ